MYEEEVQERPVKASVILTAITTYLGWGNNPFFPTLKELVIADRNGYITKDSRLTLSLAVSSKLDITESEIHKGQLEKLYSFLES